MYNRHILYGNNGNLMEATSKDGCFSRQLIMSVPVHINFMEVATMKVGALILLYLAKQLTIMNP